MRPGSLMDGWRAWCGFTCIDTVDHFLYPSPDGGDKLNHYYYWYRFSFLDIRDDLSLSWVVSHARKWSRSPSQLQRVEASDEKLMSNWHKFSTGLTSGSREPSFGLALQWYSLFRKRPNDV
ncbi:hypothetical protein MRB53_023914 [Persea americana]|uniref:Uncharacterized protein n=1 Tax=Persea americana TaxID=3435 RepID=A0ACC2LBL1_PERAE|nr:hypothetical protein MRB53_023914 [Persea americana]